MNWIRLQSEYFRHRKTIRLVLRLGEKAPLYPLRLWLWAVEQSPDGSLRDIDRAELAEICKYDGNPDDLWTAMVECGFIECTDGQSGIRSWEQHQGKLVERATRNAERMREARERQRQAEIDLEAKGGASKVAKPAFPAELDTPEFRAAWEEWHTYRRELNLAKWTDRTVEVQLRKMAKAGASASVDAIQESISNGWQGVFPGKAVAKPSGGSSRGLSPEALRAGGTREQVPVLSVTTRLQRLAASLPDSLPSVGRWRREIESLKGEAGEVEEVLKAMDARLISALTESLGFIAVAEIDEAVNKAATNFKRRMSKEDAERAMDILRERLIRERFGVPRLSIFSDEAREAA